MPTPNMGMTEPTDHGSSGTWGALLNACLDTIDSHDHTAGKGLPIPSSALKINADVSWSFSGTHYALKDALAFDMFPTTTASVVGYSSAIFTNSADNNLYFRNAGGANVQLTNGNAIAVNGVGGIGGDYSIVAALADYTSAFGQYAFRQEVGSAVRQWAKLECADIHLYEFKLHPTAGVPGTRVGLKSPPSLAGTYDIVMPTALPGSQVITQIDNTGQLSASNTLPNAITAPDYKLSSSQFITHAPAEAREAVVGTHTFNTNPDKWTLAISTVRISYPVRVKVGDRITSFTFYINKSSNNTQTLTATLKKVKATNPETLTNVSTATNNGNAPGYTTVGNVGLTETVATGFYYYVTIESSGTIGGDIVYHLELGVDRP